MASCVCLIHGPGSYVRVKVFIRFCIKFVDVTEIYELYMATSEFSTGKSIIVLAIVVGCFAILWPKIFYPMMQTAFSITAPKAENEDQGFGHSNDRPPHLHPGLMNPRIHEVVPEASHPDRAREGRPFPHPSARQPVKPQPKSGGAMSIIMPIYTIGIVVFFLYTVLKLVFKKSDADKKPLIKDFHMDPDYRKFVCQDSLKEHQSSLTKEKKIFTKRCPEKQDPKVVEKNEDYEIYHLRKKLVETENAMERIMKHMGAVSECLSSGMLSKDNGSNVQSQWFSDQEEIMKPLKYPSTMRQRISTVDTCHLMKESIPKGAKEGKITPCGRNDDNNGTTVDLSENRKIEGSKPEEMEKGAPKLNRDPSLNSDNSSFEVLSHSQNSSSGCILISSSCSECSEEKDADNEESENSVESPSFEALPFEGMSSLDSTSDVSIGEIRQLDTVAVHCQSSSIGEEKKVASELIENKSKQG